MRVLVTGGTGNVGKTLGLHLTRQGHEVILTSRSPERHVGTLPFPAKIVAWAPNRDPLPEQALEGVEGVIHLLGEPIFGLRWTNEKKRRIRESRVKSTAAVATAIAKAFAAETPADRKKGELTAKPRVLIQASAIGYYGDRQDHELDEGSSPGNDFLAEVCQEWEAAAEPARRAGVRCCAMRTGIVLDPQSGFLNQILPLFRNGLAGPVGSGDQWVSWIDRDDQARLYLWALENDEVEGPINGVAPRPVTNRALTKALSGALKRPAVLPAPAWAIKGGLGEMATLALASHRVNPKVATEGGFSFKFCRIEDALTSYFEGCPPGSVLLEDAQWIPWNLDQTWRFFEDPRNLAKLTPKHFQLDLPAAMPTEVERGTELSYQVRVHGIPMNWSAKIEEYDPLTSFTDVQVKGPFKYWRHFHGFESLGTGTIVHDRLVYKVPGGPLGGLTGGLKVDHDIKAMFDYRKKALWSLATEDVRRDF